MELNTSDLVKQKKRLWQRIQHDGPQFRTTHEERKQFKTAFITLPSEKSRQQRQQRWNEMKQRMAEMQRIHPELEHMATEDLVALQAWTADDAYQVVQNVLEECEPLLHMALLLQNASFRHCTPFPKNIHIEGLSLPVKIS
ncbi:hypothetical protein [Xanthomonas hortorum]|uniref:hypothetical protein n=1 Tax=Xanthomonas hortorum TaxID=56454 RepID=UPI002113C8E8|nr:hypothetical protein [Xanthomonas hortorum]UUF04763.1 hypothetical protein NDY25_11110 [Xanthomonas hortorum pv. pelargonii]